MSTEPCQIPLTHGKYALVDRKDYDELVKYTWYFNENGYARRAYVRSDGVKTSKAMHRHILGAKKGELTDHINRDRLDNRRSNLRIATDRQNRINTGKFVGTSRYKGVSFAPSQCGSRPWLAQTRLNGKKVFLGYFETEEDAATVYNVAAQLFYDGFAYLNPVWLFLSFCDTLGL